MDKKNYEETDPEQYKMMDGTIITSGNPDMLLNAFRTTYFAQGDYISDTEANTMRQLIKRLSESWDWHMAMETDKYQRLVAARHWNPDVREYSQNTNRSLEEILEESEEDAPKEESVEQRRNADSYTNEKSKFDLELSDFIDGKLTSNHIFNFGLPGEILKKCGFPENQRIEMVASRLQFKSNNAWHKFDLKDIYGLDKALQNPVAVIEYGDRKKSQNIVVELQKDGKNFLAGVHFNQKTRGFEVSDIRTLFPKDTIEILNWINQGKMIYGNKEKIQALIEQQRINVAEVNNQVVQSPLHEHCLESVSNLMEKFGNVNQIFTDEFDFYQEKKEQFFIYHKLDTYYTNMGTLDGHLLAQTQAEELYEALKNNNKEIIEQYIDENNGFNDIAHLAKEIIDTFNERNNSEEKRMEENENNKTSSNNELEQNGLNEAAEMLKNMNFNSENYKDLVDIISKIKGMSGQSQASNYNAPVIEESKNETIVKSYVTDNVFTGQNAEAVKLFAEKLEEQGIHQSGKDLYIISENQLENADCKPKPRSPYIVITCPPDETHKDYWQEAYFPLETVEDVEKLNSYYKKNNIHENNETQAEQSVPEQQFKEKQKLPSFVLTTSEGFPQVLSDCEVRSYNKENGKYVIGNSDVTIEIEAGELNKIINPQRKINPDEEKVVEAEGIPLVFEDKKNGVEGTYIPEFALIDDHRTGGVMKVYKELRLQSYNPENKSYTLSNGKESIVLFEAEMQEAVKNERYKKELEKEPGYKKLLENQYKDFFEPRQNTPENFKHNLQVYCRREANSPLDAIDIAKNIIGRMSPENQRKTKKMMTEMMKKGDQTQVQLLASMYHEATKQVPLNEDYMRTQMPDKIIARQFYDTLYDKGQKVSNDQQLIKINPQDPTDIKDYNLKIGDKLENITINTKDISGKKAQLNFDELTVISASKENNSITFMDRNKSIFNMPRDEVLMNYKEHKLKEMNQKNNHSRKTSIEFGH